MCVAFDGFTDGNDLRFNAWQLLIAKEHNTSNRSKTVARVLLPGMGELIHNSK